MGLDLEEPSAELYKDKEENMCDANRTAEDYGVGLRNNDGASCSSRLSGHNKNSVKRTCSKHNLFGGYGVNMSTQRELEPHDGMEFQSKEDAFLFYKEYAKSIGFAAIIKASRRSRISGKFIDAKFVCTRYGNKHGSTRLENPDSLPSGNSTHNVLTMKKRGRTNRSWSKTDCKACMHVKKRQDGRWIIHNLIKEHNHEIFPDQACYFNGYNNTDLGSCNANKLDAIHTKKRRMKISRKSGSAEKVKNKKDGNMDASEPHFALEGDAQVMIEYFLSMQDENPNFFYAIDLNEEQRLRNIFWVDAKGRLDYGHFSDVVFIDTSYVKNEYKLPFVPFIGVNNHCQFLLFGCALIGDESKSTYVWLIQTWLSVMKQAPKVILADQDEMLKEAIAEVLKESRHCFCLWHILSKIEEKLGYVIRQHENFINKFNKCILKSMTEEEFEKRWLKLVDRFDLRNDLWIQAIYDDRSRWVPIYMKSIFLGGMSTMQRLESLSCPFDKYLQRKTTLKEFLDQYNSMLQEKYEDEGRADFETWHKRPGLKSPSPFGKQMATLYTPAIFKKFQVEVLGVVACHPKKQSEDSPNLNFKVQDFEENQDFIVVWNDKTCSTSCSCRLYEFNGFLCRHIMIVLQMSGVHNIPAKYILKRWTKDAKNREVIKATGAVDSRVQRYKNICQWAFKLGDEASLSLENYNIAFNALKDALKNCTSVNSSIQYREEANSPCDHVLHDFEDSPISSTCEATGGANVSEKEKALPEQEVVPVGMRENWQQMEHANASASVLGCYSGPEGIQEMGQLNSSVPTINSYLGTQQIVQGVGELNAIGPSHDYYGAQPMKQGMEQLNLIAAIHDTQYISQQKLHGLGLLQFRPQNILNCFRIHDGFQDVDQSNMGSSSMCGTASKNLHLRISSQIEVIFWLGILIVAITLAQKVLTSVFRSWKPCLLLIQVIVQVILYFWCSNTSAKNG